MPMLYSFVTDLFENEERLSIQNASEKLSIPHLIIHGTEDSTVLFENAELIKSWNPKAKLNKIEGGNHVFGKGRESGWGRE